MERRFIRSRRTYTKYVYAGPGRRKLQVILPYLNHYKNKVLSRRLLTFNYLINPGLKTGCKRAIKYDWSAGTSDCTKKGQMSRFIRYTKLRPVIKTDVTTPEPTARKTKEHDPETSEEAKQRMRFPARMRQDVKSPEVTEVVKNARATAIRRENGAEEFQNRLSIYLETLRLALNTQDYVLACKALEGFADEWHTVDPPWLAVEAGILATINLYPNNLKHFLDSIVTLGKFIPFNPPKFATDATAWLTQKGAFLEGYNFFKKQYEQCIKDKAILYSKPSYKNVKRNHFEYISNLLEAVYYYSCYKRDEQNIEIKDECLESAGLNALNHFERLLVECEQSNFDVTIFIEPLIELLVKFKSKKEAKEVFQNVCQKNFGNGILDELYLNFLRKYFPKKKKELMLKDKEFERFRFHISKKEKFYHEQILRRYLEKKASSNTQIPFKQIKKPTFCI